MSYIGTFVKQPSEQFNITVDFSVNRLATGEAVSGSPTVTATNVSTGATVTSTYITTASVSESSGVVTIPVKAGSSGDQIKITTVITTDSSPAQKHEGDVLMIITET